MMAEIGNSVVNTTNRSHNWTELEQDVQLNNFTSSQEPESRNRLISDGLRGQTEFVIYAYFMPVFCTCGIIGNSLAISVFVDMARRLKHSIYIYMLSLVTSDSLSMLLFIVRSTTIIIGGFDAEYGYKLQMHSLIPVIYFDLLFMTMNAAILILMSLERLVSIRSPYQARETVFAKYPVKILAVVLITIALGLLPLPLCLEVRYSVGPNGTSEYQVMSKENMEEFYFYFVLLETIICQFLPYVTLMCLTFGIMLQYKRVVNKRRRILPSSSRNSSFENQLRVMATVSIIIFMYTILNLPQIFVQTLSLIDETYSIDGSESNLFWFLSDISNILIVINCSLDFVIYILMTSMFRERFKQRFCGGGLCRSLNNGEFRRNEVNDMS